MTDQKKEEKKTFGFEKALELAKKGELVTREAWSGSKKKLTVNKEGVLCTKNDAGFSPIAIESASLLASDWYKA